MPPPDPLHPLSETYVPPVPVVRVVPPTATTLGEAAG
jgi:hypothetical protein